MALERIDASSVPLDVLFPTLTKVYAYRDFRAVTVTDLANRLVGLRRLEVHPAASHLDVLGEWIAPDDPDRYSWAITASYALSFIGGMEAKRLLERAATHPDKRVRLEAAYARAVHRLPGAADEIMRAAVDSSDLSGRR